jgi:hypothetical protein
VSSALARAAGSLAVGLAVGLAAFGCAGPTAGLPELTDGLELIEASGCAAAGADAAALGVTGLRFAPAGQDLAALAARLVAPGEVVAPVSVVSGERAREGEDEGEVAGGGACRQVAWGRVAVVGEGPSTRVRLVVPSAAARAAMERGRAELGRGFGPEARMAFAAAAAAEGTPVAAPLLAVAQSYLAEDRLDEAVAVYQDVAGRFVGNPLAHAGLGEAFRRTGKRLDAADAWARAVALWPAHDLLVRRAAADPFVEVHAFVAPPARRRPDGRWAVVPRGERMAPETAAAALGEATAYATCKEAFRAGPALRASVSGSGEPSLQWRWSPAEETTCTAVWLLAYVHNRDAGRIEDAALDDLLLVARHGFLDERSFFDVGARAHPLATALLDAPARARLLQFVTSHRVMRRQQGGWLF